MLEAKLPPLPQFLFVSASYLALSLSLKSLILLPRRPLPCLLIPKTLLPFLGCVKNGYTVNQGFPIMSPEHHRVWAPQKDPPPFTSLNSASITPHHHPGFPSLHPTYLEATQHPISPSSPHPSSSATPTPEPTRRHLSPPSPLPPNLLLLAAHHPFVLAPTPRPCPRREQGDDQGLQLGGQVASLGRRRHLLERLTDRQGHTDTEARATPGMHPPPLATTPPHWHRGSPRALPPPTLHIPSLATPGAEPHCGAAPFGSAGDREVVVGGGGIRLSGRGRKDRRTGPHLGVSGKRTPQSPPTPSSQIHPAEGCTQTPRGPPASDSRRRARADTRAREHA